MHLLISVGMEKPVCRAFTGLKITHMLATSKNLKMGVMICFAMLF